MSDQMDVFFSEAIWRSHGDGWAWRIECVHVDAFHGKGGFNESALGCAAFKWLARRKIRRYRKQFLAEALSLPSRRRGEGE